MLEEYPTSGGSDRLDPDNDLEDDDGRTRSFDPRETGPLDVLEQTQRWIVDNQGRILGTIVGLVVLYMILNARYGWTIPRPPDWVKIMALAAVGGMLLGAYPVVIAIRALWPDSGHKLVDVDPVSGDVAIYELSDERFADLTVWGGDQARPRDPTTYLHEVRLGSGETGYEVQDYNPDTNEALATWMADASAAQIRRHRLAVDVVIDELSADAERSVDQLISAPEALRRQGSSAVNQMIEVAEGERNPGDVSVSDELSKIVRDARDDVDDVLEDRGIDDLEERVEKIEQNGAGAHSDDELQEGAI
jgi:hypothetical protein